MKKLKKVLWYQKPKFFWQFKKKRYYRDLLATTPISHEDN